MLIFLSFILEYNPTSQIQHSACAGGSTYFTSVYTQANMCLLLSLGGAALYAEARRRQTKADNLASAAQKEMKIQHTDDEVRPSLL